MSAELIFHRAGPGLSIQDQGREGYLAFGLPRGGAADRLALSEGAALLGQDHTCAAIEMAGLGGTFEATEDTHFALTGAPMRAKMAGERIEWNTSYVLPKGALLEIGAAKKGTYGYLHLGGGVSAPDLLGAKATYLLAGLGEAIKDGDRIAVGREKVQHQSNMTLTVDPRFEGGTVRIVSSLQTDLFAPEVKTRFESTEFKRDPRGNRMGVRMLPPGDGFHTTAGLSILSEVIVPGDIQITGDGSPFVLLSECQTTGGYPRIGAVLPADLPIVAQAQTGTAIRFQFVSLDEAVEIERKEAERRGALQSAVQPLIRDPQQMSDLLSYQLISGVIAGDEK